MQRPKKHTLRAERNMVCALCAAVFLVFAGAALAGWLCAPVPVGAVLTGMAAFVLVFTGILSVSWVRYARRFYALAHSSDCPVAAVGERLSVTFYGASAEKVAAYVRESNALAPLPERHTREEWLEHSQKAKEIRTRALGEAQTVSFSPVCPADLLQLTGKTLVLTRKTYDTYRSFWDNSGLSALNRLLIADDPA